MRVLTRPNAFSLIEILISIVVLSLGLLGLAAVFPAVVRQQRLASDLVQGVSIERSAEQYIRSSKRLNDSTVLRSSGGSATETAGWNMLTNDRQWSEYRTWELSASTISDSINGTGMDLETGTMAMGSGGPQALIPVAERLIPRPHSSAGDPRFVWDFVTRRVLVGTISDQPQTEAEDLKDDSVQVAVFVRRIDAGIRLGDRTLSDLFAVLENPLPNNVSRVPVAADADGRPTSDGLGLGTGNSPNYSAISEIDFRYDDNGRNAIDVVTFDSSENLSAFAAQPGQKLIDQTGIIHDVLGYVEDDDDSTVSIRLFPPLSPELLDLADDERYRTFIFTPQIPAGVRVFTVAPEQSD